VVPAAETVLMDGTDGREKKVSFFWFKVLYSFFVRMGPNWTDISVLWMHFSVLSDAVRTALSKKKVSVAFVTKIEHCTRMSETEC
jgi:hypothetical protein